MNFSYVSQYDSPQLRGIDSSNRPWNLTHEILKNSDRNFQLLDIGCGSSFKLIPLSPFFKHIAGIDISRDMILASKKTIRENHISNISLVQCDSHHLPFKKQSYDMITCMVSRWDIQEIHRVLKPTGILIIEHIGCEDKKDFKTLFGKDDLGWRGQFIEYDKNTYLKTFHEMLNHFFDEVHIQNGFWETHYTMQGILELLKFTPTIRNFNLEKDFDAFKKVCKLFKSSHGISLIQNRILIHAKNPRYFEISKS